MGAELRSTLSCFSVDAMNSEWVTSDLSRGFLRAVLYFDWPKSGLSLLLIPCIVNRGEGVRREGGEQVDNPAIAWS